MEDCQMEALEVEVEPFVLTTDSLDHDMETSVDGCGVSVIERNHDDHNHSFGCDHCLFTTYRRKCLVNHLKRKHCDIDETSSVTDGEGEPSLPTVSRRRCLSEGSSGATRWQVAGSGGRGGGCLCARCNLTRPSTRRKPPLSSEWITAINYPLG